MSVHVFGIRHHGPGSARSLLHALEALQPDCILVEGPPDAEPVLPLLTHAEMKPPVALLVTVPDQPHVAAFYPFALFSPEWQAIRYGLSNDVTVRFMDLPQAHSLALQPEHMGLIPTDQVQPETPINAEEAVPPELPVISLEGFVREDPMDWMAKAAGYPDGEAWWDRMVEHRRDGEGVFDAILEAMSAMREEMPGGHSPFEAQREAHMRKTIREAEKEGFQRIAVVCGAWHAPALINMPSAKDDNTLLKGLPKVKVEVTWVPWTYSRLDRVSGYGAGVTSPGWYEHLWIYPEETGARWITRAARHLRGEDLDASTAQVIDAVRFADTLAALRGFATPGLDELGEGIRAALSFGSDVPMHLIHRKLIVGEKIGEVPDETPMVPLQRDLMALAKRLRMPLEDAVRPYDLDLRKPNDLERSILLHRLRLLGITWGTLQPSGNTKGTFHEIWSVQWQPELAVRVIEASMHGNTVESAADSRVREIADAAQELTSLTALVSQVMLADLPDAARHVMDRVQDVAALTSDVTVMMDALPALAAVMRYGNVRQTDTEMAANVVAGLVTRIAIGLPGASASLDDDAAGHMFKRVLSVNSAIGLLNNEEHTATWQGALLTLAKQQGLHGLIAGRATRILLDTGAFDSAETERHMRLALSPASPTDQAGAWIEGFLRDSGLLLLHDDALWRVLDEWVISLAAEVFKNMLPLLRRTFATFPSAERRQMGERVRQGAMPAAGEVIAADLDPERVNLGLPLVAMLLGLELPEEAS
jgi:hypothetical protein